MTTSEAPTIASVALATAILCLATGYLIGTGSSLGLFGSPSAKATKKKPTKSWPNSYDVTIHPDSSDEELMEQLGRGGGDANQKTEIKDSEDEDDESSDDEAVEVGELSTFEGNKEECKLVLVVRTDLGMGKGPSCSIIYISSASLLYRHADTFATGKIAAQASHATLACYDALLRASTSSTHPILARWQRLGQAKIAVQAHSEDELHELQARAMSLGLCARVIRDAGRTQIASGTTTVLGVGPGPKSVVDQVTGGLKLL